MRKSSAAVRIIDLLKDFAGDFAGSAAGPKSASLAEDTPGSALIAVVAIASSLNSARNFVVDSLGIAGAFLPALVAIAGLLACVYAICSKTASARHAGFAAFPNVGQKYSFGIWTRRFAKLGIIAFCIILPRDLAAAIEESSLLPLSITGMIIDAATQVPVDGARVRIVTNDAVDVTNQTATAETDSHGIFVAVTTRRVRRNATLAVYRPGWKPTKSPLWKRFQTLVPTDLKYVEPSTSPFFTLPLEFQK